MNAEGKEGTVRIKLTISREEHPAMFEALASIRSMVAVNLGLGVLTVVVIYLA